MKLNKTLLFSEHDDSCLSETNGSAPFILKRGFEKKVVNKRVLVVDDVTNTGFSIKTTIDSIRQHGGEVTQAACLVDRGNVDKSIFDIDVYSYLAQVKIPAWPASACPLCQQGVPINTQFAHGNEFLNNTKK